MSPSHSCPQMTGTFPSMLSGDCAEGGSVSQTVDMSHIWPNFVFFLLKDPPDHMTHFRILIWGLSPINQHVQIFNSSVFFVLSTANMRNLFFSDNSKTRTHALFVCPDVQRFSKLCPFNPKLCRYICTVKCVILCCLLPSNLLGWKEDSHHAAGLNSSYNLSLWKKLTVSYMPPPPCLGRLFFKGVL